MVKLLVTLGDITIVFIVSDVRVFGAAEVSTRNSAKVHEIKPKPQECGGTMKAGQPR